MKKKINIIRSKYITTAFIAVVVFLFVTSCNKKKTEVIDVKFDPETMPSMITDSVSTLISDSGVTRYNLVADIWEVFDKAQEPNWFFPEGIHLEQFDDNFKVQAIVDADTAWNFILKKLWKLKGNVFVRNTDGDEFRSEELYWDQRNAKVYSNTFIEIKKSTGLLLKGYRFESNQAMTDYEIIELHDSRVPLKDEEPSSQTDSLQ